MKKQQKQQNALLGVNCSFIGSNTHNFSHIKSVNCRGCHSIPLKKRFCQKERNRTFAVVIFLKEEKYNIEEAIFSAK